MAKPPVRNLFAGIPTHSDEELIEDLARGTGVRIERIVSLGHCSPEGFWYDQTQDEWVMVLRGSARLRFEGEPEAVVLNAGDALTIPAHVRHRVDWTEQPTIWLAVHYR